MRKSLAYLLLILYTLSYTEVGEFCKIGTFVAHFYEHKQENKELSLVEFVKIHYANPLEDTNDSDYQRDQELPFKGDGCVDHMVSLVIKSETNVKITPFCFYRPKSEIWPENYYISAGSEDIWQPPKVA